MSELRKELISRIDRALCESWYSADDDRPHAKARRTIAAKVARAVECYVEEKLSCNGKK